jgi:hypothetical protein
VKDKVDVLSWQAAGVKTKITDSVNTPEERDKMHNVIGYIEPLHAVESAFKDLGHTDNTEGSYLHCLSRILLQTIFYLWCCGGLASKFAKNQNKILKDLKSKDN